MKIKIRRWYWGIMAVWAITGLPIYLIGQGFAGPEHGAFTIGLLVRSLTPPAFDSPAFTYWLIGTTLQLLPLLMLPFALRVRRNP